MLELLVMHEQGCHRASTKARLMLLAGLVCEAIGNVDGVDGIAFAGAKEFHTRHKDIVNQSPVLINQLQT